MTRAAILFTLAALSALPATASVQDDLQQLQTQYRDEQVRARRLRADAIDAQAEMAALDRELATLRRDQTADDAQLSAQRERLRQLGRREAAIVAELAQARDGQGRLLSGLQMMSRKPPPPLLIPADRAVDTVRAAILMKAMAPELQRRAAVLSARQAEVVRIRRLAVLSSERLLTTESAQGDRRAEVETLSARRTALLAVLRADAARAERAAAALEARIRALGARPVEAAEASDVVVTRLPAGRSRLTSPVSGAPTSRFGSGSSGLRWPAPSSPVASPAAAVVDHAGPLSGWGQVVILDLGGGWRAVVAGLDAVSVAPGDRVADGQALGASAAGDEVYFELRRDDRAVDPAPYL
ncbi:MAG: peptidoglycan DD-metalloendopeptidase family protein [Alphaproteobacteria bacterium]|nr:peptidoglycan DD-metalloendopeptidase family protein [Alphaproteobacteria bacterium]MBU2377959.1 peptidoglycan DD-metalloendopeptidase family protein [Alphaproteobacteria bacterium]